jgi:hypothetical protein
MSAQWMTNRDEIAEKLRPADWNQKLPRVPDDGDALVIARTVIAGMAEVNVARFAAGAAEEAEGPYAVLSDLILDVDEAIDLLDSARDSGDREEIHAARENLEGTTEEFLAEIRRRLLPDVVAAEEAEAEHWRAEPLTGLGS